MTETALRSRAYRRQIPFHLNGRKITFTESDLREIAECRLPRSWDHPEGFSAASMGPAGCQ
jgi:hypothetical protein